MAHLRELYAASTGLTQVQHHQRLIDLSRYSSGLIPRPAAPFDLAGHHQQFLAAAPPSAPTDWRPRGPIFIRRLKALSSRLYF